MASRRRHPAPAAKPEAAPPVVEINGWKIYAHPVFIEQFEALVLEVERLRAADPDRYREKKKTKLLAAIRKPSRSYTTRPTRCFYWAIPGTYRHW
jgi:toxin YhaV